MISFLIFPSDFPSPVNSAEISLAASRSASPSNSDNQLQSEGELVESSSFRRLRSTRRCSLSNPPSLRLLASNERNFSLASFQPPISNASAESTARETIAKLTRSRLLKKKEKENRRAPVKKMSLAEIQKKLKIENSQEENENSPIIGDEIPGNSLSQKNSQVSSPADSPALSPTRGKKSIKNRKKSTKHSSSQKKHLLNETRIEKIFSTNFHSIAHSRKLSVAVNSESEDEIPPLEETPKVAQNEKRLFRPCHCAHHQTIMNNEERKLNENDLLNHEHTNYLKSRSISSSPVRSVNSGIIFPPAINYHAIALNRVSHRGGRAAAVDFVRRLAHSRIEKANKTIKKGEKLMKTNENDDEGEIDIKEKIQSRNFHRTEILRCVYGSMNSHSAPTSGSATPVRLPKEVFSSRRSTSVSWNENLISPQSKFNSLKIPSSNSIGRISYSNTATPSSSPSISPSPSAANLKISHSSERNSPFDSPKNAVSTDFSSMNPLKNFQKFKSNLTRKTN